MKIERRGFLKLGAAIVGALTLTRYAEPALVALPERHEWIEDRGDFVIVRVPDFKAFANEVIAKPAIFVMGQQAIVKDVDVAGFANIYAPKGGMVTESRFNASKMAVDRDRAVVDLNAKDLTLMNCHIIGNHKTTAVASKGAA